MLKPLGKLRDRRAAVRPYLPPIENAREECGHVHWEDVRVGAILSAPAIRDGTDLWQWSGGFYAGSHPAELHGGTAPTFDRARAEFNKALARVSLGG